MRLLRCQNRVLALNTAQILGYELRGSVIYAHPVGNDGIAIARYDSEDDAKTAYADLLAAICDERAYASKWVLSDMRCVRLL